MAVKRRRKGMHPIVVVLLCVLESMGCEVKVWGGENPHALELICCA